MSCNCKDKIIIKYLRQYQHDLKFAKEGDAGLDTVTVADIKEQKFNSKRGE